ncbi:hypothetical protein KIH23_12120 [Flavobacterium sp. CYK-55]|uniref:hypothetical protein n=1 Tax=Flavobacterium sp. CYK-55 TaxID=2835529 RepID=UPI001BCDAA0D|nr:hypothetical protein [Flavobacterium sp. CYK-55]MBS7788044.1 hypothetical protein [Flavobacterium sp. CYK-55]
MKPIRIAIALFFLSLQWCVAQKQSVDSLVKQLDNKDAYIVLTYTMSPRVSGTCANDLVKIGKKATPELIKVLENANQGIIAHFILSEIWKDQWQEENCCRINKINGEEIITLNELEIHIKNNLLYATAQSLHKNKERWTLFWQA